MTTFEKDKQETTIETAPDSIVLEAGQKMMEVLPRALIKALSAYEGFLEKGGTTQEPLRDYQEHQTACKSALAHIELLIKLADRIKLLSGPDEQDRIDQLEDFVADALVEIENRKNRKKEGETP